MVGVIEAIDDPNSDLKVGDLTLTLAPDHRAMTEYYVAPTTNIFKLPSNKPLEHYLQAQQLGTVIYACKKLPSLVGKDVAVIGQGSAGLWFTYMARRMGAKRVIGVDLQSHRLQASKIYGATDTVHNQDVDAVEAVSEVTNGALVDVVIEAAGEKDTTNMAIDLGKDYAFLLYFGVPHFESLDFNMLNFFMKCQTAQPIVHAPRDPGHVSTRLALDLIERGEIDMEPILTHTFPFEKVFDAYELFATRDEGAIKVVVEMSEI